MDVIRPPQYVAPQSTSPKFERPSARLSGTADSNYASQGSTTGTTSVSSETSISLPSDNKERTTVGSPGTNSKYPSQNSTSDITLAGNQTTIPSGTTNSRRASQSNTTDVTQEGGQITESSLKREETITAGLPEIAKPDNSPQKHNADTNTEENVIAMPSPFELDERTICLSSETVISGDTTQTDAKKKISEQGQFTIKGLQIVWHGTWLQRYRHVKLKDFPKEKAKIPQQFQRRLDDLIEFFTINDALYKAIYKDKFPRSPLKIGLRVLGEDEATAKPWIVVQCKKMLVKRAVRFFHEPGVKEECQPKSPGDIRPRFEVVIIDVAPWELGCTYRTRLRSNREHSIIGAAAIDVYSRDDFQVATLGGMVKVVMADGNFSIYGITAGHVVPADPGEDELNQSSEEDDEDDEFNDLDLSSWDSPTDSHFLVAENEEDQHFESTLHEYPGRSSDLNESDKENTSIEIECEVPVDLDSPASEHMRGIHFKSTPEQDLGTICQISRELDWALIQFDVPMKLHSPDVVLTTPFKRQPGHTFPRPAVVFMGEGIYSSILSGGETALTGELTNTSYCILPFSTKLTEVFDLVMHPAERKLRPGDSGSWAISGSNWSMSEVYGHVVCSDIFGEASVVPLTSTLLDIQRILGAETTSLPNEEDLEVWRQRHCNPCSNCKKTSHVCDEKLPCTSCNLESIDCTYSDSVPSPSNFMPTRRKGSELLWPPTTVTAQTTISKQLLSTGTHLAHKQSSRSQGIEPRSLTAQKQSPWNMEDRVKKKLEAYDERENKNLANSTKSFEELTQKEIEQKEKELTNFKAVEENSKPLNKTREPEVQAREKIKKVLDIQHLNTLTDMANRASKCWNEGRSKEAEELFIQETEMRKRLLSAEHPSTLTSMSNLASTFSNQGRWKEAEELLVHVIEMSLRVLGEEHPDTLTNISKLASAFWNQGRRKEAEEPFVIVMETRKRVLGEEHPDTLTSISNLASTFWNQGRRKEAEELFVQVIEMRKRVLGEEHPDTLTSISNLASTVWNQGRREEAGELLVQVIEMRQRVLGVEHPDTLTSMSNLALTFSNQGRWKEAEELLVQVIETRKRVLGVEHPDTLNSISNLASTFGIKG